MAKIWRIIVLERWAHFCLDCVGFGMGIRVGGYALDREANLWATFCLFPSRNDSREHTIPFSLTSGVWASPWWRWPSADIQFLHLMLRSLDISLAATWVKTRHSPSRAVDHLGVPGAVSLERVLVSDHLRRSCDREGWGIGCGGILHACIPGIDFGESILLCAYGVGVVRLVRILCVRIIRNGGSGNKLYHWAA